MSISFRADAESVLAGRAVWVHPQNREVIKLVETSILTSGRVADGEAITPAGGEDKEVVTAGHGKEVMGTTELGNGLELVVCPVVAGEGGDDVYGRRVVNFSVKERE